MYPAEELAELDRRKAELRGRIAASRLHCATLAGTALRPLAWIDRMLARWRKVSPVAKIAALPLLFALRRRFFPQRLDLVRRALRWLPTILGVARAYAAHRHP